MISHTARKLSATMGMTTRAELDPDTVRDLREALKTVQDFITFLKADWLQSLSESCALEDV